MKSIKVSVANSDAGFQDRSNGSENKRLGNGEKRGSVVIGFRALLQMPKKVY